MNILKNIENTYKDTDYINVVGVDTEMEKFIKNIEKHDINHYRVCTCFVYLGNRYKIVFFDKKDENKVIKLMKEKNLALNGSNPFF